MREAGYNPGEMKPDNTSSMKAVKRMDEVYLTVKEVAELKGCGERTIQLQIQNQTLHAEATEVKSIGPGRGGIQYRIPLSALDKPLQVKHRRKQLEAMKAESTAAAREAGAEPAAVDFEKLTFDEREQISFWKSLIWQWESFRASAASKAEADERFEKLINAEWEKTPPSLNVKFSLKTLYKKQKALRTEGEAALIDRRGKHENHTRKLTDEMIFIFEKHFLTGNKLSIELCRVLVGEELKKIYGHDVELPSVKTFERHKNRIPIQSLALYRDGVKAFEDKYAPYIPRDYTMLAPNDVWVVDGHTLDVMAQGKDGKPVRLYISAWMDVRTRKMMGVLVTDRLDGDSTLAAFRKGVERYGAPKMVFADNGRENLFYDFMAAAGFRKKAGTDDTFIQPTILGDLDIKARVALPEHPKSKPIERAFRTYKENFSKLFDSYTGGNVLEKPDGLEQRVKQGNLPTAEFIQNAADTYTEGGYNKHPHRGDGMNGRSPDEVFCALDYEKRVVPHDRLKLMFMRYSKGTMKVGKLGVTLRIYGGELQFTSEELYANHCGREVFVRYNPEDLSSVRVFDTDGAFLCDAQQMAKTPFISNKEEMKEQIKKTKAMAKTAKNYKNTKQAETQSAFDAMMAKYAAELGKPEAPKPKVSRIIPDKETLPKAVGAEYGSFGLIDLEDRRRSRKKEESQFFIN